MLLLTGEVTLHVQELRMCDKAREQRVGHTRRFDRQRCLKYCCRFSWGRRKRKPDNGEAVAQSNQNFGPTLH